MRKTKIICTLGPSTDKDGVLEELVKEGLNVARFNFSHGLHDEQKGRIDKLKEIRTRLGKPVAALLDTKGPEIRIREFENEKVTLKEGQDKLCPFFMCPFRSKSKAAGSFPLKKSRKICRRDSISSSRPMEESWDRWVMSSVPTREK